MPNPHQKNKHPNHIISTEDAQTIFKDNHLIFNTQQTTSILQLIDKIAKLVLEEHTRKQ